MTNDQQFASLRPWSDSLALVVILLFLWNAVVLYLVYTGATEHSVGNDAAGAGMSRGFREIYAMISGLGVAVLALLSLLIRHRGVRLTLIGALAVASCLTPMML